MGHIQHPGSIIFAFLLTALIKAYGSCVTVMLRVVTNFFFVYSKKEKEELVGK